MQEKSSSSPAVRCSNMYLCSLNPEGTISRPASTMRWGILSC